MLQAIIRHFHRRLFIVQASDIKDFESMLMSVTSIRPLTMK
jgi:hypothetical protein